MSDDQVVHLTLRIPRSLHAQLAAQARKERRTLNAQILRYVEQAIAQSQAASSNGTRKDKESGATKP